MLSIKASELADQKFVGYGKVRLQKIDEVTLRHACVMLGIVSKDTTETKHELIEKVVKYKRSYAIERRSQEPCTGPSQDSVSLFLPADAMQVLAFNTLKLRTTDAAFFDWWKQMASVFVQQDVVMLSEVPGSDATKRVDALLKMMNNVASKQTTQTPQFAPTMHSADLYHPNGYNVYMSEKDKTCGDVHVALVRNSIKVVEIKTLHRVCDVEMSHAPFVVTVVNSKMPENYRRWNFVSVHMAPCSTERRPTRDRELRAFLEQYPLLSELRSGEPFTTKGAKDAQRAPCTHVIAGDFNTSLQEIVDIAGKGVVESWEFGVDVPTTCGGRSYDHFMVSKTLMGVANRSYKALPIVTQNSRMSLYGISDHYPILMQIEIPSCSKR